jgi:hypothetical protein
MAAAVEGEGGMRARGEETLGAREDGARRGGDEEGAYGSRSRTWLVDGGGGGECRSPGRRRRCAASSSGGVDRCGGVGFSGIIGRRRRGGSGSEAGGWGRVVCVLALGCVAALYSVLIA